MNELPFIAKFRKYEAADYLFYYCFVNHSFWRTVLRARQTALILDLRFILNIRLRSLIEHTAHRLALKTNSMATKDLTMDCRP